MPCKPDLTELGFRRLLWESLQCKKATARIPFFRRRLGLTSWRPPGVGRKRKTTLAPATVNHEKAPSPRPTLAKLLKKLKTGRGFPPFFTFFPGSFRVLPLIPRVRRWKKAEKGGGFPSALLRSA